MGAFQDGCMRFKIFVIQQRGHLYLFTSASISVERFLNEMCLQGLGRVGTRVPDRSSTRVKIQDQKW